MTAWELAAVVLSAALVPCLGVCVLSGAADALAAFEVGGTVTTCILLALSEGFHRQPFVDLAVVMALISMLGALTFARLMEHEL